MRQLKRAEAAIRAGASGPERLGWFRELERVVVTYDAIPFASSFLRDLAAGELGAEEPHAHACSIDELE